MNVPVYAVVLPHELAPEVIGVYFERAEAEAAAEATDGPAVVDRSILHA
ncbi:hypothetical protein [Leifsonia sp. NPDC080035]|uniref:Uncharacterized protein n=1 Tax=Leifsonia sp. NPDC080035 TaxID=3143936 RepID=A0AAU7G5P7_9MICO